MNMTALADMTSRPAVSPGRYQQGTALLVSMVMIFMLSIMGISAMRSSTMERRMASNAIQAATAFQAAESSTEIVLNNPANLADAWDPTKSAEDTDTGIRSIQVSTDMQLGEALQSNVELRFMGNGLAKGYSAGLNQFMALRYEAQGTASIDAVRARSIILQGATRVVPAPAS